MARLSLVWLRHVADVGDSKLDVGFSSCCRGGGSLGGSIGGGGGGGGGGEASSGGEGAGGGLGTERLQVECIGTGESPRDADAIRVVC